MQCFVIRMENGMQYCFRLGLEEGMVDVINVKCELDMSYDLIDGRIS